MKCSTAVLCLFAASLLLQSNAELSAQASNAPTSNSVGPQAVKLLVKQFTVNPQASDPVTHKPLRTDGSWSIGKNRPAACLESAHNCAEVFYTVPEQSAKCSWIVSLNESGDDGAILDENDDADAYMLRSLSDREAANFIQSRSKPVTPPIASAVRVSGPVVLKVVVGKSSDVQNVRPVSGPPMLQQAAMDAAKNWKFKEMKIGARPVSYVVQVTFTFYPPIGSMPGGIKMAP